MNNLLIIETRSALFFKLSFNLTQIVQKNNYNAQAVILYIRVTLKTYKIPIIPNSR